MSYNGEIKPQSIMNILGYTVSAKDVLSEDERITILRYAIESGIITNNFAKKGDIIYGVKRIITLSEYVL